VDTDVRVAAIESLPAYEDERIFSALRCLYKDENSRVRTAVVKSLGQMDSKLSYDVLSLALQDSDQWVRYYAVKSVSMHGFVEVIPRIREMAFNDPAAFVKLAAIEFLGRIGGQVAASILVALTGDKNNEIALAAISSLGDVHHPDSLAPLLALSSTTDPDMKRVAIEALGRRGGTGTSGALQWVAITEKDPIIRNSAVNSLKLIANRESISALLNLTSDTENRERAIAALAGLSLDLMHIICEGLYHKNSLVRTAVVEVLLRMHSPLASAELAGCLKHNDPKVRLATVNALNKLGNRKYMKKLLELKNTDPDPAIRKAVEDIIKVNSPDI
jgi:HEAT repeat protein